MSVRAKLLVIITFVALVPLSFSAYTTLGLHQEALDEKIAEVHVRSAKYGAKIVEANLERMLGGLVPTIESSIRWAELSESEREELERLRQENTRLRMERDFAKKVAAWFAKEQP